MAYFSSVPTKKLEGLDKQLVTLLEQIAEKGIDMKRMAMIIKRDRLKVSWIANGARRSTA